MFYPVDSLKRGGRFYLCWVADSWPLRFATITHRQLWSQDIRVLCDDLLEVVMNESGRPTHRFSLRLSSQLLRGLVRLYQRKVNVILGDLCRINANVFKNANKKWFVQEVDIVRRVRRPLPHLDVQEIIQKSSEKEQGIVEIIQASGNVVANIQDITLREPTITVTEMLLKPNDDFGEEHPDQPLQLLQDRTLEMMLLNTDGSAAHSGLEPLDLTDKSHDKTRLNLAEMQMERISEHELTMLRKSTGEELMPGFEKDIPEIPEIPPPELPVPSPEKLHEVLDPEKTNSLAIEQPKESKTVDIELEELEVEPQTRKRKIRNKLIIDKKIKINAQLYRSRVENPLVELRCEDSSEDIIHIQVPCEFFFRRPCHGGERIHPNIGFTINQLFGRNLGVISTKPRAEREIEEVMQSSNPRATRSVLERIEEEQETSVLPHVPNAQVEPEFNTTEANATAQFMSVCEPPRISVGEQMELDLADMPTQKVETLSQARKRIAEQDTVISPKKHRSAGYVSFRESQKAKQSSSQVADLEADKENRTDNIPPPIIQNVEQDPREKAEKILSSMLQEAGLADIQVLEPSSTEIVVQTSQRTKSRGKSALGNRSDSTETPLGSLDRTKVSLGDSEQTTDSKRFMRDQWGTEGTMLKILKLVKVGRQPVTVSNLVSNGPTLVGHGRIIAARCFASILKLKQHRFIEVCKDSCTLEITAITLGPKLTNSQEQF